MRGGRAHRAQNMSKKSQNKWIVQARHFCPIMSCLTRQRCGVTDTRTVRVLCGRCWLFPNVSSPHATEGCVWEFGCSVRVHAEEAGGADRHGDLASSRYICRKPWEKGHRAQTPRAEPGCNSNAATIDNFGLVVAWGLFWHVHRGRYFSIFVIVDCRL